MYYSRFIFYPNSSVLLRKTKRLHLIGKVHLLATPRSKSLLFGSPKRIKKLVTTSVLVIRLESALG